MGKNSAEWEHLLESEGLGVINVAPPFQGANYKHIKGKWARLEAELNDVTDRRQVMSVSPQTAVGIASPSYAGSSSEPAGLDDYESGRFTEFAWENMLQYFSASPLEARIADRSRGAIIGLDHEKRVIRLRTPRKPRELPRDYRKRILRHIMGDQPHKGEGPVCSEWKPPVPPHATRDAGNGPLSIKDPIVGPREIEGSRDGDVSDYPIKVVDTHTYLPGRSPFQMSRFASSNSDITG